MASASLRATWILATSAPRWRPEAGLGPVVVVLVARMTRRLHSSLDECPAQILRSVLRDRTAEVFAAGLVDAQASPGHGARPAVDDAHDSSPSGTHEPARRVE
jgi:hypothetical protein